MPDSPIFHPTENKSSSFTIHAMIDYAEGFGMMPVMNPRAEDSAAAIRKITGSCAPYSPRCTGMPNPFPQSSDAAAPTACAG